MLAEVVPVISSDDVGGVWLMLEGDRSSVTLLVRQFLLVKDAHWVWAVPSRAGEGQSLADSAEKYFSRACSVLCVPIPSLLQRAGGKSPSL